jgi:hypothetical protein
MGLGIYGRIGTLSYPTGMDENDLLSRFPINLYVSERN